MKFGDIFKAITGKDATEFSIHEIERITIKEEMSSKSYGKNIVSNRGNIFKNKKFDIDSILDKKLAIN